MQKLCCRRGQREETTSRSLARILSAVLLLVFASSTVGVAWAEAGEPAAPAGPVVPEEQDGKPYPVSAFTFEYAQEHDRAYVELIGVARTLGGVEVALTETARGYIRPREGAPAVALSLEQLSQKGRQTYYGSAINTICERVVAYYASLGFIGIFVEPKPEDINAAGTDLRAGANTALRLGVWVAVVKDVRTIARGKRVRPANRINDELHEFIRGMSPIQPDDILKKDALDDYVLRLNRFPARRVDVSIASAGEVGEAGEVSLDYLVSENKSTFVYTQLSNTGTETTEEWRERVGLVSHHFLKNDAVFNFDYVTAGFENVHAIVTSYEAPLTHWDSTRWRVNALWSEFDASEVSITSERFQGEEIAGGLELIENFYAKRDLFADVVVGAQWRNIMVRNETAFVKGREDFLLPHVGVRMRRARDTSQLRAAVTVEGNLPSLASTQTDTLRELGRLDVDKSWVTLQWSSTCSFFLEPIINPKGWEDPTTPASSTLAHEIALTFAGQYAFNNRLAPQFQSIVGGFYTVRGYDESVAAGDNAYVGSIEYRCHIPRRFKPQPNPRDLPVLGRFKLAPQNVYDRPDWDLIFRTFADFGRTEANDKLPIERHENLMGTGVGLELQIRSNINVRCDYGIALSSAGDVDPGDDRVHVSATLLW